VSPELMRSWTVRGAGAQGAKLSGAGCGGHMIALVASELVEVVTGALYDAGG
jgi:mevalonate kinase